ncbi:MAG TPA: hypothetical protein VFC41_04890 [Anaerovoracaceae bacterium]|nr:hypothetical protein [Anaerovoracaceae bacterium]
MQTIIFKYKGTMIQVTKCLNEVFKYEDSLKTVREALNKLNENYQMQLSQYIEKKVFIVFEKDGEKSTMLSNEIDLETYLGINNVITFYYPFKGG